MTTELDIKSTIEQLQGSGKTFAEFLAILFKDKLIEIYLGDSYEDISTDQVSVSYPAVICGKVVAAYKECLIVSCAYTDQVPNLVSSARIDKTKIKFGNNLFINERAIRSLNEIDGKGVLEDMLLRSRQSLTIMKLFNEIK